MDKKTVIEHVRRNLARHRLPDAELEVVEADVKRDRDLWYVPVRATRPLERTFELYDTLAQAEGELDEEDDLTVLFVPVYDMVAS